MTDPVAADLRSRSKLLFAAAIATDLAGVAALGIVYLRGGDIVGILPLAVLLFVAASGLLLAAIGMRKKAEAAEA
jgi:hypothetical protein